MNFHDVEELREGEIEQIVGGAAPLVVAAALHAGRFALGVVAGWGATKEGHEFLLAAEQMITE